MRNRRILIATFLAFVLAVSLAPGLSAQESAAKGTINGTVVDSTGGSIAGAQVTVTGPVGNQNYTTANSGLFIAQDLIPGTYTVRVEVKGFKVSQLSNVLVNVGSVTGIRVVMEPGSVTSTVEVVSSAVTVDTTSTAVATNLSDDFYNRLPVQRGVAGLFYLAPGVVSGGGTGASNPSIGGASGLENLYVADGVSITDTAFGGLGIYSRVYGSVGTGINLAFIKEVQVKTGGFQPQYGGATGGVVQIVTKSGGHDFHGAVAGYWQPQQFEAQRVNPDDFGLANPFGKLLHNANADVSGEIGDRFPECATTCSSSDRLTPRGTPPINWRIRARVFSLLASKTVRPGFTTTPRSSPIKLTTGIHWKDRCSGTLRPQTRSPGSAWHRVLPASRITPTSAN